MNGKLLCNSSKSMIFIEFIDEIYKLKFDQRPDYDKLKYMLMKIIDDDSRHKLSKFEGDYKTKNNVQNADIDEAT